MRYINYKNCCVLSILPYVRKCFAAFLLLFVAGAFGQDVQPIPNFYQEAGLSPNREYVNQNPNEHIDPFTGKLQLHYFDLIIPGNGGLNIQIQRSYSSLNETLDEPSPLGVGWTMHFGRILRNANMGPCFANTDSTKAPILELPDGSRQVLYLSPDTTFNQTINRWRADCATAGTGLIVKSPDGTRYEMTTPGMMVGAVGAHQQDSWYTTRIIDKNGNTLNFTYVTVGKNTAVSTIFASDGRLVTFNYSGNNLDTITSGGRIWTYTYTYLSNAPDYPFLAQVQRPDGNKWQYSYNLAGADIPGVSLPAGTFSMASVTYPTGGTVSYEYGFVTFNQSIPRCVVVTQKSTQDTGGFWLFSYAPAQIPGTLTPQGNAFFMSFPSSSMLDVTTMTGPDGVTTYYHVGADSVVSGFTYAIGFLLQKTVGSGFFVLQSEAHSFAPQLISNTQNIRPGGYQVFDAGTFALITTDSNITRDGQAYDTQYTYDDFGNVLTSAETGTATKMVGTLTTNETRNTTSTYDVRQTQWMLHLPLTTSNDIVPGNITNTYDTNGNLLTSTRYGVATLYSYTPEGDIETKRDARGNTATYLDYYRGIPRQENQPEGVTLTRQADIFGNVTSETDGEGVTTQFGYDSLNRITSIVHAEGNPVAVAWLYNERDVVRGNYTEKTIFDGYGRPTTVVHQGGAGVAPITQTTQYDALGRKLFVTYPNQTSGEAMTYDILGRVSRVNHAASPGTLPGTYTVGSSHKTTGYTLNSISTTNERGITTATVFRAFGDPDKAAPIHIEAGIAAGDVTIARNGLDQITQVQQGDKTRTYTYDSHYFLTQTSDPEVGITQFGRDAVGNMTSRQVGASGTTNYAYDGRNRVATVTYPSGTPGVTHAYFHDDKLQSVDNGLTHRSYTYRLNKQLDQENLTAGGQSFWAKYAYDGNDALQGVTYSTGLALSYSPDAFGRPTQAMPFAPSVSFFPSGQLQHMQYTNGLATNFTLNDRQWPNAMTLASGAGAQAFNMSYNYDGVGNVLSIGETVRGLHNRTFDYDHMDRLTSIVMPSVSSGSITYDGRGNILTQAIGATQLSYQYDATTDKLLSVSGSKSMSFNYDVYGNVTSNSRNQFVYDDALNMRCVDCGTANEIDYVYDGAGMRVSELKGGVMTYFMYGSGGNLLFEQDTNGVKREYGYVAGKNIAKKETR